jgi:hypothetical protein
LFKSLKLLRDTSQSSTEKEVANTIQEDRTCVIRVLERLRENEVVAKAGEFYSYQKTDKNERFFERMSAVYDKIGSKSEGELIAVGLLSLVTQYNCLLRQNTLVRVLEEEGFDSKETNSFLDQEVKAGRVEKIAVTLINKGEAQLSVPSAIHLNYVHHLMTDEYDKVRKKHLDEGFAIQEEDYLAANFSPELSDSAKEHLNEKRAWLRQKIRDETFESCYRWGIWR